MKFLEDAKDDKEAVIVLLDKLLKTPADEHPKVATLSINPSSLSCEVQCAFKLQGIPQEPENRTFNEDQPADSGTDYHRRLQTFMSKTPYWVNVEKYINERPELKLRVVSKAEQVADMRKKYEDELASGDQDEKRKQKVKQWLQKDDGVHIQKMMMENPYETLLTHTELPLRFTCDGILFIYGKYHILEIKTEREEANITRTNYATKHQNQGTAYSHFLQIFDIVWCYVGRDSMEPKWYIQTTTALQRQSIESRIRKIADNYKTPEKLDKSTSCTYCRYKKHCKAYFKALDKAQTGKTTTPEPQAGKLI